MFNFLYRLEEELHGQQKHSPSPSSAAANARSLDFLTALSAARSCARDDRVPELCYFFSSPVGAVAEADSRLISASCLWASSISEGWVATFK